MCVVGSYAIRNSFLDVYVMLGIGLLGYVLQRVHIPVTPIVLGLVLGGIMERDFRTALLMSEGDPSVFYTSPIAMGFFVLTAIIFTMHVIGNRRAKVRERAQAREQKA
jgi:putative tricarboxylic transport membrane protein